MMPQHEYEGAYFKIDGKDMPIPSAIGFEDEVLWSSNTGRSSNGETNGDIIDYKKKIKLTWDLLTREEMKLLKQALKPAFFSIYFLDDEDNTFKTITCFRSNISSSVYGYAFSHTYKDVSVDLTQK